MPVTQFFSNQNQTRSLDASNRELAPGRSPNGHARAAAIAQSATKGSAAIHPEGAVKDQYHLPPHIVRHRIVLPVNTINQGTLTGLRYAQSLSSDVTAVHISTDPAETEALQKAWPMWGEGVRLVVLESPHNMVLEPLLQYIQSLMALKQTNEIITIVVPQNIQPRWWSNLTRTQMAVLLRLSLPFETGIVITDVPYVLEAQSR